MKTTSMILALAALAPIAIAMPTADTPQPAESFVTKTTPRDLSKRDTYWMEMYADANFAGASVTFSGLTTGVCYFLPAAWDNRVSSQQHSQPHSCRFWDSNGCTGDVCGGTQDAIQNFQTCGLNDRISSFRCS
ncbi:hypothetical protein BGZ60DRAFT_435055 [Tricladium varicosporioides]|nr:hypothetical protein BGZ60DRAFT_435055 [Hymenoscyphus varicosporioides]